VPGNFLA